jgi:hypothetical protein
VYHVVYLEDRYLKVMVIAGIALYPDREYPEIRGRAINRTPLPQTFLRWANPVVSVNGSLVNSSIKCPGSFDAIPDLLRAISA